MTGTGAYYYITWGIWLRHCLNGRQEEFRLEWPHVWSLPEIVGAGHANGATKGSARDKARAVANGRHPKKNI
jgi:dihydroceramidase